MNRTVNTAMALLAGAAALASGGALAQAFPSKPIKVVIPFVAGGSSDIVGRAIVGTPEEFGRFMKAEVDRWTTVVNRGGIKPD